VQREFSGQFTSYWLLTAVLFCAMNFITISVFSLCYFCSSSTAPSWLRPLHYRGFTITLRHTTLGRTPPDQRSARRKDLYLTKHNTRRRQTSMSRAGFEPTIPEGERPQTQDLWSIHIIRHDTARYNTTRQNIFLWFSYARIHTSPSPTAKDKNSVAGTDRREYFARPCLSLLVVSVN
jgi:hypothetical protein